MKNCDLLRAASVFCVSALLLQLCGCQKQATRIVKIEEKNLPGTYRLTAAKVTACVGLPIQVSYPLSQTERCDTYTFLPNGSFMIRGAQTPTGGIDPDDDGTWFVRGTTIRLNTEMQGNRLLDIIHQDAKELVLTFTGEYNGRQAQFVSTFEKQL